MIVVERVNYPLNEGGAERREEVRFMITFRIPTGRGNAAVKDGSLPDTLQSVLEDLKPEAAYFADIEGARGGNLVVNMDDASQIPAIAEPLFLALDATVQVHPVFTPEDMPAAMESLQQAAQKYG
jgi:hypothetical protein